METLTTAAWAFVATVGAAAAIGLVVGALGLLLDWIAAKGLIWLGENTALRVARRRHNQARIWYTRAGRLTRSRHYHIFGLDRCVGARSGSFWALKVGPISLNFGMRPQGARHYKEKR